MSSSRRRSSRCWRRRSSHRAPAPLRCPSPDHQVVVRGSLASGPRTRRVVGDRSGSPTPQRRRGSAARTATAGRRWRPARHERAGLRSRRASRSVSLRRSRVRRAIGGWQRARWPTRRRRRRRGSMHGDRARREHAKHRGVEQPVGYRPARRSRGASALRQQCRHCAAARSRDQATVAASILGKRPTAAHSLSITRRRPRVNAPMPAATRARPPTPYVEHRRRTNRLRRHHEAGIGTAHPAAGQQLVLQRATTPRRNRRATAPLPRAAPRARGLRPSVRHRFAPCRRGQRRRRSRSRVQGRTRRSVELARHRGG